MTRRIPGRLLTTITMGACLLMAGRTFAQRVDARLKDIGLYTEAPIRGQPFYALRRESVFPSDGRATIYTEWLLPQPGHYTVRYQVSSPAGSLYVGNTHPFDATEQIWPTWFTFSLPKGEKAKALAGRWKAEVFLNAERVATLLFELMDQDRRVQTDVAIAVFPFLVQDEVKETDPVTAAERVEVLKALGSYVASELQRLFPRVVPPQQTRALMGEDFTSADAEKPTRLLKVRKRVGAEVAITGRVMIPEGDAAKAALNVAVVNVGTGVLERFHAGLSEGDPVISPKDLVEDLTLALLAQPAFLSSVRALAGGTTKAGQGETPARTAPRPTAGPASPPPPSETKGIKGIPEIVKEQADAVVFIRVTTKGGERRVGSGFVVRKTGEILTNFHLVDDAKTLTVKLKNEDVYDEVTVLETDARRDIALIKVRGWNFPVTKLGNSDVVQVGERVVAIGNPRGLEQTVTDGLVSAIRDTGKGYKLFQMSAPISTGSSGGPLFDMAGEAIGIAAAYLEGGQNLNFAIPINYGLALLREDPSSPTKAAPPARQGAPGGVMR